MDMTAVRRDLAAAVRAIEGLTVHEDWADRITPPAFAIGPPDTVMYRLAYGRGATRATISARVYVTRSGGTSLDQLDPYLASSGPQSIPAAVDAHDAAATAYSAATVTQVTETGVYTIGNTDYLGATVEIDVIA